MTTEERAQQLMERLTRSGVTHFTWCGIVMFACPHCHTQNEDPHFMLAHARDHFGDDGMEATEAGSTIDDAMLAELPAEEEEKKDGTANHYTGSSSEPVRDSAEYYHGGSVRCDEL